jgi:hypothetical protein
MAQPPKKAETRIVKDSIQIFSIISKLNIGSVVKKRGNTTQ